MAVTNLVKSRLPKPTKVFDSFWYLAAERQRIFRARLRRAPEPLTNDPVLRTFKFTNAYRASDRTSQYLIRQVIYEKKRSWRDTFARILLFKLFNRIETWEIVSGRVGELTADTFDVKAISSVLDRAMNRGYRIYSAAYIMPSALVFGSKRKHENHLRLLKSMLTNKLEVKIEDAQSMRAAFEILLAYPSIGPFLAYQLITDLNYCPSLNFREESS